MGRYGRKLMIWRTVGIAATIALVVVSALLVMNLQERNSERGVTDDGVLLPERGTDTDKGSNSTLGSTSDLMRSHARVSYLGPVGTYTEEAVVFFFDGSNDFLPQTTVYDAIALVREGKADYAVIPQENSIGGAVTNYVDALIASDDVYVVGEVVLPICQTLMGIPGARLTDITTICSHAKGLAQSEIWRKEHLPDATTKEMSSTAAAASYVANQEDKTIAAVAAPAAAGLYGLEVLAENVQITDSNKTRFYVLGMSPLGVQGCTNAVFIADCEANMIDDILVEIHDGNLEIETIHVRPEGNALGRYFYVIEVKVPSGIAHEQIERICCIKEIRYAGSSITAMK